MSENPNVDADLIDRVCRGVASTEEGARLRDRIRDLQAMIPPTGGVAAIAEERRRQIGLGRTPLRDAASTSRELARAGAAYVQHYYERQFLLFGHAIERDKYRSDPPPDCWPWSSGSWNPQDARRDLERAGALIAAEIDRLDRQSNTTPMHFILFGGSTVKTKCGIKICATYPQEREALPLDSNTSRIKYTEIPSVVTCQNCLDALQKMGMPK